MKAQLDQITVGSNLYNKQCLFVWPDSQQAMDIINDSPVSDEMMMSTTTYHRAANRRDVLRIKYDRITGDIVTLV